MTEAGVQRILAELASQRAVLEAIAARLEVDLSVIDRTADGTTPTERLAPITVNMILLWNVPLIDGRTVCDREGLVMDLRSAIDYAKGQAAYLGNLHVSIPPAMLVKRIA
jgi:hypothetical protein